MISPLSTPASKLACITLLSLVMSACGLMSMDPPVDGIQIKVSNQLSDTQTEALVDTLKSYDTVINSTGTLTVNEAISVNLSPITDLQDFIQKMEVLGTIGSVDQNVVTLEVDVNQLS